MNTPDTFLEDSEAFVATATSTNGSARQDSTDGAIEHMPRPQLLRRILRYTLLLVLALAVALATFLYDPRKLFDGADEAALSPQRDTTTVRTTDLADEYDADATLVFSDATTARYLGPPGVLTDVFSASTPIERGDVVWRVNNEPTVALFGDLPHYRELDQNDVGPDVEKLEANLVILGYDPDNTVTVDDTFTANTALMVKRWQEDIDAAVTGKVPVASVLVVGDLMRTGEIIVSIGDSVAANTPMATLTSVNRVLQFTVPASERDTIGIGDTVDGRLPDRSTFTAIIDETLILDNGAMAVTASSTEVIDYAIDTVPVEVSWRIPTGVNVLTVSAGALIRTDSRDYFVEVVLATGETRFVRVDTGRSSGSTVEISGDIADGDIVIAP